MGEERGIQYSGNSGPELTQECPGSLNSRVPRWSSILAVPMLPPSATLELSGAQL